MTTEEALKILDTIPTISEQVDALEMAIKALEQQPCEDCISRQEAISAIQDEYYADAVGIDIVDIIANLPSVTPTISEKETVEDCISREAVDEYITNLLSGYLYDEERTRLEDLSAFVWELPSVQPTRPTARWEKFVDDYNKCSNCGVLVKFHRKYKYCPNCGARMAESEDVR